jgi:hypothetical protein
MSFNGNSINTSIHRRQAPTFANKTPFCSVCKAAGRSDFNTHYVRDRPGGIVVCKYLLGLNCGYCGDAGHMPSHCPVLKKKKQETINHRRALCYSTVSEDGFIQVTSRSVPKPKYAHHPTTSDAGQKRKRGGFAALADDSDDELELHKMPPVGIQKQTTSSLCGWIAAVKKPAVVNKSAVVNKHVVNVRDDITNIDNDSFIVLKNGSWVDEMSDEED